MIFFFAVLLSSVFFLALCVVVPSSLAGRFGLRAGEMAAKCLQCCGVDSWVLWLGEHFQTTMLAEESLIFS